MLGRDVTKTNNAYDYLDGGAGSDTITGGDADENISGGNDDDILSGNYGDDIISGGQGMDVITGGDGADTITGGDGSDTLTGGLGQDIFVYSSRYDYGDVITDFTAGSGGDLLDFRPLFNELGYSGADPFGEGWLQLEQSGADLKVNLDRNGGGDSYSTTMATLKNVLASDFTTQNALPAGPLTPIPPSNHAPTDITLSSSTIEENSAAGTVVGNLTATILNPTNTFVHSIYAMDPYLVYIGEDLLKCLFSEFLHFVTIRISKFVLHFMVLNCNPLFIFAANG